MRRRTFTLPVIAGLGAVLVLAPAAAAVAVGYGEPAPGGRTCFTATDNGNGTTSVTTSPDFEDPNLDFDAAIAWFESNVIATDVVAGGTTVVVGITPKRLTATTTLRQECGGIDNVGALLFENENDFFEAEVPPVAATLRGSGVSAPTTGTDTDGSWTLPYDVPAGIGGTFVLDGFAGLMNWNTAVLNADGSVASFTQTDDDIWFSVGDANAPTLKVLRQSRGTVSGPASVKPNTTFLLRVQTQQAGDGAWAKLPYATVKIDRNTGSGWKYLKTVKTTSTGIYNTRVQQSVTTQYRFRYYGSATTASYTAKTFTVKRG